LRTQNFELPYILSASLIPSRNRPYEGQAGDALLLDIAMGVMAVADGPERNPRASAMFLDKFVHSLEESGLLVPDGKGLAESFDDIVSLTNELIKKAQYHESTTFSAFLVGANGIGALLHTGDSMIFLIRDGADDVVQLSRTNHYLIGRSPKLHQAEVVSIKKGDLVLLATDGLTDLARCNGKSTGVFLSQAINNPCPRKIADHILECIDKVEVGLDDIAIISADLDSLKNYISHPAKNRLILKD